MHAPSGGPLGALERRIHLECTSLRKWLPRLRVAEPFHGLGSFGRVMKLGGLKYLKPNSVELDHRYKEFYHNLYRDAEDFVLVGSNGDILSISCKELKDAEGLVGGPQCTPWAGNGKKGGITDPQSQLYEQTTDWIIELCHRGVLLFYAVENSINICKKEAGGTREAFADRQLLKLRSSVPFFKHEATVDNLRDKADHDRNRCILRGMRRDVLQTPSLPRPLTNLPHISLDSILDWDLPNVPFSDLTEKARLNLLWYEQQIQDAKANGNAVGAIAVVETHRAPDRKYKAQIFYDVVPPLRAGGNPLFLMSTCDIEKPQAVRKLSRPLVVKERLLLQGQPVEYAEWMSPSLCTHVAGNAWAVPAIASVLIPMLQEISYSGLADECGEIRPLTADETKDLTSLCIAEDISEGNFEVAKDL